MSWHVPFKGSNPVARQLRLYESDLFGLVEAASDGPAAVPALDAAGLTTSFGMAASEDDRLLDMVRAGNLDGLAGLFDRHGPACLSAARLLLGVDSAAEDVVFDVFLDLWRRPTRKVTSGRRQFCLDQTIATAHRRREAC